VPLGGKPETGNHDGAGRIFVNIEDRNEIVAFDARTLAVQAHWPMPTCDEPTGQAIDRAHHRLFVGCGGNRTMTVVDYDRGTVLATLHAGEGVDATAFDPETQIAFASGGDGTLTMVHQAGDQFHEIGSVPTMRGARTMALDPRTHRVYTVSAEFGPAPAPTAEQPRPRRPMVPGSFVLLVLEP
jgi:DNA-binding beta-propeller fold protein YncE